MTVAFMVAEEKVFTQRGAFTAIKLRGYLDGWSFRMFIILERDIELLQIIVNYLLSVHRTVQNWDII